jgi:hypothetical protein
MTLYQRYAKGDHEEVWRRLALHQNRDADPETAKQAELVAAETMKRVAHNLGLLLPRLKAMRFHFVAPLDPPKANGRVTDRDGKIHEYRYSVYDPPGPNIADQLQTIEDHMGALPTSLKAWYTHVGHVSLSGDHPVLCNYARGLRRSGERVYCDPLVVHPALSALAEFMEWDDSPFLFPISPDADFKHGVSGGGWEGVYVPSSTHDAKYTLTGEYFVEYLRRSFAYACFPGWRGQPDAPAKEISALRKGFVPF